MKNDTITVVICYFGSLSTMFRTHTDDEKKFAPEMVKKHWKQHIKAINFGYFLSSEVVFMLYEVRLKRFFAREMKTT